MALNTPHARRHLPRLLRRGFTTYISRTGSGPGMGLSITDPDGSTRDYVGTPAQAIALAAGRRAATGGGWNGESGAASEHLTYWMGGPMRTSRRRGRGRSETRRVIRHAADQARMDAEDAARGYDRDME